MSEASDGKELARALEHPRGTELRRLGAFRDALATRGVRGAATGGARRDRTLDRAATPVADAAWIAIR